jgi:L-threonylcarbamoyladenylate synthase
MKTKIVKVNRAKPEKGILKTAAEIIDKGGLVAFPTETVYGLAADYLNKKAMDRLYKVKKRPKEKPFTVHISDFDDLIKLACHMNIFSKSLIEKFWPGPLTLVLRAKSGEKIGVRMPKNKVALQFISECKNPIVAPSANLSGNEPPRKAESVLEDLEGKIDMVLDGGETELGVESTVLDASALPYRLLRRGAIKASRIADIGREIW